MVEITVARSRIAGHGGVEDLVHYAIFKKKYFKRLVKFALKRERMKELGTLYVRHNQQEKTLNVLNDV